MAQSRPTEIRRNRYGRQSGPRLRTRQRNLYEELLPRLRVPLADEDLFESPASLLSLFHPQVRNLWLEIGFGAGEHLHAQAAAHPEAGVIGCETYVNGIASFLSRFEDDPRPNIRLHDGDARDVLDRLPDACLQKVFLLFPDPWPKRRHVKRRFVQAENLDMLARVMRPCAQLLVATDVADYCRSSLIEVERHPSFLWTAETPADWRRPPPGSRATRYEAKAIESGRKPIYLSFSRVS